MAQKKYLFKICRVAAGLSQAGLANKVGSNQTEISFIENRRAKPTPSLAHKIAKVLDVDSGILFPHGLKK
jgi:DNA-binding XRE family transcriptional regulator